MSEIPFTAEEAIAIEQNLISVTVPLLLSTTKATGVLGTGTLLRINERSFVVTASHLFDDGVDPNSIGIPENPHKGDIYTLGHAQIYRPKNRFFDVAVIELLDKETIERMNASWRFLGIDSIGKPSIKHQNHFLAGYPYASTTTEQELVRGKLINFHTAPLNEIPEEAIPPVDLRFDLFFHYGLNGNRIDGNTIRTPKLEGISGASVWAVENRTNATGIWIPASQAKVIGVQSAYVHSKYIRVKNWAAVAMAFEQIDEEMASHMRNHFK